MNHKRTTKRTLALSLLVMLLCVAMLVGTTFAWFTDSASTGVNTIQAGTLDVALEMKNADGEWESAEGKTLNFVKAADAPADEQILWEPGCTYELPELRIVNNGNLALKYKIQITGIQGDAELNNAIEWTMTLDGSEYVIGSEHHLIAKSGDTVDADVLTIKGHMKEEAGNEYQGKSIEGIAITVVATQLDHEFDSNGNDYDASAEYPVVVSANVDVTADNKVATETTVVSSQKAADNTTPLAKVTIPAGAAVVEGTNQLKLTIDEVATPANIEVAAGADTKTFEVDMKGLDKDSNNALFKVELYVGTGLTGFSLKHNGADMTKKDSLDEVAADQEYYYSSSTGVVTFLTKTFSPFTAVYDKESWSNHAAESFATPVDTEKKVVTIASAEELALFAKEVNNGTSYAGYTVKLTNNIDLMGDSYAWTPINGFTGTFDGGDHTVSNLWVYGGDTGEGFGLFGDSNAKCIENIRIHNAYVYGNSAVAALIGKGFTTTITNAHVDGLIQIGTTTHNGHIANFNSSYIGGIIGWGYAKVSNCSVKGDDGSVIGGGRQVGGIYGFAGEGKSDRVTGCTVENVKLVGTRCVGGIIGWAHNGNNVKNCSVSNVDLEVTGTETNTIGTITGTSYTSTGNNYDEFVDNTAVNCTMTVDGKIHSASAPFDMYATYASGSCYIKRGDNTYVYCENEEQANAILQDGDSIFSMAQ